MLVQVTRLACKGFVLVLSYNHAMANAKGLPAQFLPTAGKATQDRCRGAESCFPPEICLP